MHKSTSHASRRMKAVADWFGVPLVPPLPDALPVSITPPREGQILLVTGPSGSGKSRALAALAAADDRAVHLHQVRPLPGVAAVDQFAGETAEGAVGRLCRVGLGEAQTYLRRPHELSDGQLWRLRLAIALHRRQGPTLLVCDEFAAVLDRVTAMIVSRNLRRTVSATPGLAAMVATSHDDLEPALQPDAVLRCDRFAGG